MILNTWSILSLLGFIGAGIVLVTLVITFFRSNIIGVIGIVTGKTATREIERVWEEERKKTDDAGDVEFYRRRQSVEGDSGSGRLRASSSDTGGGASSGAAGTATATAERPKQSMDRGRAVPSDALAAMQIQQLGEQHIQGVLTGDPAAPKKAVPEQSSLEEGTLLLEESILPLEGDGATALLADDEGNSRTALLTDEDDAKTMLLSTEESD